VVVVVVEVVEVVVDKVEASVLKVVVGFVVVVANIVEVVSWGFVLLSMLRIDDPTSVPEVCCTVRAEVYELEGSAEAMLISTVELVSVGDGMLDESISGVSSLDSAASERFGSVVVYSTVSDVSVRGCLHGF
jgi:hypothetical protein